MASSASSTPFDCTRAGHRLAGTRLGNGPPLIQTAMWFGHRDHEHDSPMAGPLMRALAPRHAVLRFDPLGSGASDRLQSQAGLTPWLQDLEALVDAAAPGRFALLGVSQGAAVAIAYAARHPGRVSRLVLHGGYARGRLVRDRSADAAEEASMLARLAEIGWGRADEAFRQIFTTQLIPGASRQQQARFNEMQRLAVSPDQAALSLQAFDHLDVTALLPQVRCPTLVLHSRHDAWVPFDEGRYLASAIQDAEFVSVESRNHLLLDTEPAWPRWLAQVQEFLAPDAAACDHARVWALLTERQRCLIDLMAQGLANGQIASAMGLSEKTVRNHISSIFDKLDVESRSQAIVRLRQSGFGTAGA